uniref:Uncharacterized protein n=1 Tax=Heterorhabditis bacteriophora TaxID=37862 RepID=A0A1I7WEX3_HETBA
MGDNLYRNELRNIGAVLHKYYSYKRKSILVNFWWFLTWHFLINFNFTCIISNLTSKFIF